MNDPGSESILENPAPRPEGPQQVRAKFEALNRRPPWDVIGHAADLASKAVGKLDLRSGLLAVIVGETIAVCVRIFSELPYTEVLALAMPAVLAFFHRKEKDSGAADPLQPVSANPATVDPETGKDEGLTARKLLEKLRPARDG